MVKEPSLTPFFKGGENFHPLHKSYKYFNSFGGGIILTDTQSIKNISSCSSTFRSLYKLNTLKCKLRPHLVFLVRHTEFFESNGLALVYKKFIINFLSRTKTSFVF